MIKVAKHHTVFWVLWIAVLGFVGVFNVLPKRPQSMHQWAQCDRGSIALNYAEESMNFFKPRVHECKNLTGITGLEFPIVNYTVAICYKVFGFNELWYRLLMLLITTLGVFYAVKLSGHFIPSYFYALLITFIWYLSPILNYYTANFLPDMAGLGFCMSAWWFFFKYQKIGRRKYLLLFTVLMSLASLVKITYLISVGVVVGIFLLDYLYFFNRKERKPEFQFKKSIYVALGVVAVLTVGWYKYSAWLSEKYMASYFLLDIRPETDINKLVEAIYESFRFWGNSFYYPGLLLFIVLGVLFITYYYKHINRVLLSFTVLYFLGISVYYFFMIQQFRHHDYYFISTFPMAFFLFLTLLDVVYKVTRTQKVYLRMGLPFVMLYLFIGNADFSRGRQTNRYEEGSPYNTTVFLANEYKKVGDLARKLGITRDDRVITSYDPSPNISLYFMDLKGYSFSEGHQSEIVYQRIHDYQPGYLILNDKTFLEKHSGIYEFADVKLLDKAGEIGIYQFVYK